MIQHAQKRACKKQKKAPEKNRVLKKTCSKKNTWRACSFYMLFLQHVNLSKKFTCSKKSTWRAYALLHTLFIEHALCMIGIIQRNSMNGIADMKGNHLFWGCLLTYLCLSFFLFKCCYRLFSKYSVKLIILMNFHWNNFIDKPIMLTFCFEMLIFSNILKISRLNYGINTSSWKICNNISIRSFFVSRLEKAS